MTHPEIDERGGPRPALTSLRFVAALLVFVTHAAYLSPFADPAVAAAFDGVAHSAGHLGVAFFFVLSGFVLTWSAGVGESVRAFYRRRFVKIVPNHLVVFLPALGLMFLMGAGIGLLPIVLNLFLLQAWVWDVGLAAQSPNSPTWSLGAEVFFYLLFPLLLVAVRRIPRAHLWVWWVAIGLLIAAIPVVVGAVTPSGPPSPAFVGGTWLQQKILLFLPVTRLPDFVIGMITARLVQEGRFVRITVGRAAAFVAVVYVAALALPRIYTFAGPWAFPVALLVGAAAAAPGRSGWGLLTSRPALWAGELSYALFLVHLPLMLAALLVVGSFRPSATGGYAALDTPSAIVFILIVLALAMLVSRLLFVLVERPAMRRWSRSSSPASTATATAVGAPGSARETDLVPQQERRPGTDLPGTVDIGHRTS